MLPNLNKKFERVKKYAVVPEVEYRQVKGRQNETPKVFAKRGHLNKKIAKFLNMPYNQDTAYFDEGTATITFTDPGLYSRVPRPRPNFTMIFNETESEGSESSNE